MAGFLPRFQPHGPATVVMRRGFASWRGPLCLIACLSAMPATGCITPSTSFSFFRGDTELEAPVKVVTFWDRNVRLASDCVNNGNEVPGLAGRVYFFGAGENHMIAAKGRVVVEWFDASHPGETPTEAIGRVEYLADDLQKMKKKDFLGIGYTLFLPWPSYRPEISRVNIRLCFLQENRFPMYAEPSSVSLQGDAPVTRQQQIVPATQRTQSPASQAQPSGTRATLPGLGLN